MISCLCVTQPQRVALATLAIGDFVRQTIAEAELVVLHDGGPEFDAQLRAVAALHAHASIRIESAQADLGLGALRNLSVQLARGEWICQWDDDDRYHPRRLELQFDALTAQQGDFCFLTDQLHWFPQQRELFWDDWRIDPYPLDFVQGTLFGRKAAMPEYPAVARGEDTEVVLRMMRAKRDIVRLRDQGWVYIYVYHGANVFPAHHHAAISQAKRYSGARLVAREGLLRQALGEYSPGIGPVTMPWDGGALSFP